MSELDQPVLPVLPHLQTHGNSQERTQQQSSQSQFLKQQDVLHELRQNAHGFNRGMNADKTSVSQREPQYLTLSIP